jgi:hypothetical protein
MKERRAQVRRGGTVAPGQEDGDLSAATALATALSILTVAGLLVNVQEMIGT